MFKCYDINKPVGDSIQRQQKKNVMRRDQIFKKIEADYRRIVEKAVQYILERRAYRKYNLLY